MNDDAKSPQGQRNSRPARPTLRMDLAQVLGQRPAAKSSTPKLNPPKVEQIPQVDWRGLSQIFAMTPEGPCPYIEGRQERKVVTPLSPSVSKASELNWSGFRRSHSLAYRPACVGCQACKAVRVVCADFKPSKSQKRTLKRAAGLQRNVTQTVATDEHFNLFEDYVVTRHGYGDMALMGPAEHRAMIEETPVSSVLMEWRAGGQDGGQLVAACLVDVMVDGLSMVYSYFDPKNPIPGLGTFMILDLIAFSREKALPYLYLGYWIKGSPKMDYKVAFRPLQVHQQNGWHNYSPDQV